MLAAESFSVEGHLAAATARGGAGVMECKPSHSANKKLIQARLPFKRLNSEPKENLPPKRACVVAPAPLSDRENECEPSAVPRPPLVNGRGPLDGFLSRSVASEESVVIDLTLENTRSPVKYPTPAPPPPSVQTSEGAQADELTNSPEEADRLDDTPPLTVDSTANSDEEEEEDEPENQSASVSQLDTTQDSDSDPDEEEEEEEEEESSASSASDTSPERPRTEEATSTSTPTEPKTTPKVPTEQKVRRRSLKSLKEQEERLRLRQEKEQQREEAKAAKEKKKEEARKLKEEQKKERLERKEKEEREKREKKEKEEKEKAEKLKAKEELRKSKMEAKMEEKRKKEEEKKLKEEEKKMKEEQHRLKAEKGGITRFLKKPKMEQAPKTLSAACGKFAPFELRKNMSLAPVRRVQCADSELEELDRCLVSPSGSQSGLKDWIGRKPRCSGPTRTRRTEEVGDCVAVDGSEPGSVPDRKRYGPMKLLQFHANHRPAFWGTCSKKSTHISPRCPLRQDKDLLDYEVDSDEEWEEEEPGESLSHSEGEDEEEGGEDDDEDDDGFFVPHGYLSEDEGALEEEEEDGGDPEKQKLRQKLKAREWDELMSNKKRMKVLEPVLMGCTWDGDGPGPDLLRPYAMCLIEPLSKAESSLSPDQQANRVQRETQLLGQLVPLLHGNMSSSRIIITEFQEFCRQQTSAPELSSPQSPADTVPTRVQLKRLIQNHAVYEKRSSFRRCCWYVHADVLARLGQEELPVPCQWTYLSKDEAHEDPPAATGSQGNSPTPPQNSSSSSSKRKSSGSMSIKKFMKRCSDPEQMETADAEGFHADTEDDDKDECVIVSTRDGPNPEVCPGGVDAMEVTPSDAAALPGADLTPPQDPTPILP